MSGLLKRGPRESKQAHFESQQSSTGIMSALNHNQEDEMNQEQFQGRWEQLKGDLKKKWGKFTDDDLTEIEGDLEKFNGKLQEVYGNQKQEISDWTNTWFNNSR